MMTETTTNSTTPNLSSSDNWQPPQRKLRLMLAVLCLIAAVLIALYAWQLPPFKSHTVSTNNAYIRGQTTLISPRVSGYVTEVWVQDFAQVKKGDALVKIDDEPYRAKVAQAQANLAAQTMQLSKVQQGRTSADANIQARKKAMQTAASTLKLAQINMQRLNNVKGSDGIAKREYDQAVAQLEQAQAAYEGAKAQYTVAQQDRLGVDSSGQGANAAVEGAKATLNLAEQELAHTIIYAPDDGKLGEIAVKKGQLVSAGSQLMFLVPPKHWVIANFKETDTAHIRIGQTATIKVDALDKQVFHGKVSQIAPATAAEFSMIRADSGTGNFVKIPQRIAVKIELDEKQESLSRLAPGMSVEASVDIVD